MKVIIDPVKQAEQFKNDLAAMKVGPKDAPAGPVKQRSLGKNFGLVQFKFNRWSAELEELQTLDDALDPAFFVNHAETIMADRGGGRGLKGRGDIIEVRKLDSGLFAELLVVEAGKGYVKCVLVREARAAGVAIPEASALGTRWNNQSKTHEVIRKADGVVLQGGFQSKQTAAAWIAEHQAKVAA